jgi:hypothetical protein
MARARIRDRVRFSVTVSTRARVKVRGRVKVRFRGTARLWSKEDHSGRVALGKNTRPCLKNN